MHGRTLKNCILYPIFILVLVALVCEHALSENSKRTLHDISVKMNGGEMVSLDKYKGKVVMIANTASKCAFTVQYAELQELHETYEEKGFTVLGFPSNDFKQQEPGSDKDIKEFCKLKYGVTFPLFAKDHVIGEDKSELFRFLTEESADKFTGEVQWNFEKFLIGKDGILRGRYGSFTNPMSTRIQDKVKELLDE